MASSPLFLLHFINYSVPSSSHRIAPLAGSTSALSNPCTPSRPMRRGHRHQTLARGGDLLGDFGSRDPFPAEIASNFGENVLGNVDTVHRILIPNISALSLSQRSCEPVSPSQPPMSIEDAEKMLKKVVGWRLVEVEGRTKLRCLWKLRDYGCGVELITRIYKAVGVVGHYPELHLEHPSHVRAELWTTTIGGLSINDFIVAAKIDEIKILDLLPKKRTWA